MLQAAYISCRRLSRRHLFAPAKPRQAHRLGGQRRRPGKTKLSHQISWRPVRLAAPGRHPDELGRCFKWSRSLGETGADEIDKGGGGGVATRLDGAP